jgi:hypothetical protein
MIIYVLHIQDVIYLAFVYIPNSTGYLTSISLSP